MGFSLSQGALFQGDNTNYVRFINFHSHLLSVQLRHQIYPFFLNRFRANDKAIRAVFALNNFHDLFNFFLYLILILCILNTFRCFFNLTLKVHEVVLFHLPAKGILHDTIHLVFCRRAIANRNLNSFNFYLRFFRDSSPPVKRQPISVSTVCLEVKGAYNNRATLPDIFVHLLQFNASSIEHKVSTNSSTRERYPSVYTKGPSTALPDPN